MMPAGLLTQDAPLELRERAARAAKRFNASQNWIPLAVALREIEQQQAYRAWAFRSFSSYVETELDVRKSVASELMSAHEYLSFRHPESLDATGSAAERIPSYANVVILARHVNRLPEPVIEKLDAALFRGEMKRYALQEAIRHELLQREAPKGTAGDDQARAAPEPRGGPPSREIRETAVAFFEALNLPALREQITLVFDGWNEVSGDERRQLLMRLHSLIDQLLAMQEINRQRPSSIGP